MSANAKNVTPADVAAKAEEKTEIPAQQSSDAKSAAVLAIGDALKAVENKKSEGLTVKLSLDENGELQIQVDETAEDGKAKKLLNGAKGVFNRNKKLVLASAGLLAASVVLKVVARRQAELEADEIVETSDDVAVDA